MRNIRRYLSTLIQRVHQQRRQGTASPLTVLSDGWQRYIDFVDKYGWRATALNTAVLMTAGDLSAQYFEWRASARNKDEMKPATNNNNNNEKKKDNMRFSSHYDFMRTLRFGGGGLMVFGPVMHAWYSSLDRHLRARTPLRLAMVKMLCDQLLFMPLYLVGYISLFAALEGNNRMQVRQRLDDEYSKLLIFSYKLWPAVQIANFYFVPHRHRVLVINFVGLIYYTYLDWHMEHQTVAYCDSQEEAEVDEEEEVEDHEEEEKQKE